MQPPSWGDTTSPTQGQAQETPAQGKTAEH